MSIDGSYYDGRDARRRLVELSLEPPYLVLQGEKIDNQRWRLDRLSLENPSGDYVRVHHPDGAHIAISNPGPWAETLRAELPLSWDQTIIHAIQSPLSWIALITVAALVLVGTFLFLGTMARQLAPWIPPRQMQALGRSVKQQVLASSNSCTAPAGQEQIERLSTALSPGDQPITVTVVDEGIVNAMALPGGEILIFRGILD